MDTNEVKKALYRERPTAQFRQFINGVAHYRAIIDRGPNFNADVMVLFEVPVDDMGTTIFDRDMPAQLLIRWLVKDS